MLGAKPVYFDVEANTCNVRASKIADKNSPRTKMIILVSLYGQCPDLDEINAIAVARGDISVIEDTAQSIGALAAAPEQSLRASG